MPASVTNSLTWSRKSRLAPARPKVVGAHRETEDLVPRSCKSPTYEPVGGPRVQKLSRSKLRRGQSRGAT
eukprot:398462-Pyramimonas_sp.AAC.2